MSYYKNTTQVSNVLFNDLLKTVSFSQLKVLLTIIHKTVGQVDKKDTSKRKERAWISQKLFSMCTSLSGKAVSKAIEELVVLGYIEVTNQEGELMHTKEKRRRAMKLYYVSRLRLKANEKQNDKQVFIRPVTQDHTIKLNTKTKYCYNTPQVKKISDTERYKEIIQLRHTRNLKRTETL